MGEFGAHSVEIGGERTVISGRCYTGPLRRGDTFVTAKLADGRTVTVALTILRMEAYQRELDELDEGLSARLTLIGVADLVADGCVLGTESP